MNVADIITRVRRSFGDESAVQIKDEDVIRWINDAQVAIVLKNDAALQKSALMNLVSGQSQYTLPSDFLVLRSLRYKYSTMTSFNRLRYKSIQQFDEELDGWDGTQYDSTNPIFYTVTENTLIVFPTPDQSNVNGLKILYNQKPVDVVDSLSTLSLPLIYHNSIVAYCMWQASLLDEDNEPALMYKGEFLENIGDLKNKETKDPLDVYPTITILADDL